MSFVFPVRVSAWTAKNEAVIKGREKKGFPVTRKGKATNIELEENSGSNRPVVGIALEKISPDLERDHVDAVTERALEAGLSLQALRWRVEKDVRVLEAAIK
jgi:hypothetical protein